MGFVANGKSRGIDTRGSNHGDDVQTVVSREIEVSLIVGRTTIDSARTIFHEDKIGYINRKFAPGNEGMKRLEASIETLFLGCLDGRLGGPG